MKGKIINKVFVFRFC